MGRRSFTWLLLALIGLLTIQTGLDAQTVQSLRGAPLPVLLQKIRQVERLGELRQQIAARNHAAGGGARSSAMQAVTGISGRVQGVEGTTPYIIAFPDDGNTNDGMAAYGEVHGDGTYLLQDIGPGTYRVVAQAEGYQLRFFKNAPTLEEAQVVTVTNGQVTGGVDITLEKMPVGTGSISGRVVRNSDGAPVSFCRMFAYSPDNPGNYGEAITEDDGTYSITGLFSGTYYLEAWSDEFIPEYYDNAWSMDDATPIVVQEPAEVRNIDFRLSNGATISGRVLDTHGNPVVDAWVEAMGVNLLDSLEDPDGWPWMSGYTVTDENGYYEIPGLAAASYIVSASAWTPWADVTEWYRNAQSPDEATPVVVAEDETAGNIDFAIDLPLTNGSISGVVRDKNNKPVPGAIVQVMYDDGTGFGYYDPWVSVETDASGRYSIPGLPDGRFYVIASGQAGYDYFYTWWPNAEWAENATAVVLENALSTPASVDFTLAIELEAGSIAGTVRLADGTPLAGANVELIGMDPDSYRTYFAYTTTDDLGRYSAATLPAGMYTVRAYYSREDGYGEQWYLNAGQPDSATPVALAKNQSRNGVDFNITVRPTYGRLTGRIVDDATGAPITRALVQVSPVDLDYDYGSSFGFHNHQVMTDATGTYNFNRLPQGHYTITVYADGVFEVYDNVSHTDNGTLVEIQGGESTTVDIGVTARNAQGGTISGSVTGEQGEKLDLAVLLAWRENGMGEDPYITVTKADGTYRLAGLPDGDYVVMSFAPDYITEFYRDVFDPWEAMPVTVEGGETISGIDFTLIAEDRPEDDGNGSTVRGPESGGIIYGKVTSSSGTPLRDATVYLLNGAGDPVASSRTAADGTYEFSALPPDGNYRLRASSIGYESRYNDNARSFDEAAAVTLLRGRMTIDFVLDARLSAVPAPAAGISAVELHASRPNPVTGTASLDFSLATPGAVRVAVVDLLGRQVAEVHSGYLPAGEHTLRWNPDGAGNGVYIWRVEQGGTVRTMRMTVVR